MGDSASPSEQTVESDDVWLVVDDACADTFGLKSVLVDSDDDASEKVSAESIGVDIATASEEDASERTSTESNGVDIATVPELAAESDDGIDRAIVLEAASGESDRTDPHVLQSGQVEIEQNPEEESVNYDEKSLRAERIANPNRCHGKTRRKKCVCASCRHLFRGTLDDQPIFYQRHDSDTTTGYMVTAFDLLNLPSTMEKRSNWTEMREALSSCATNHRIVACKSSRQRRDIRRIEEYDVEIIGTLRTPQLQFRHELYRERAPHSEVRAWKWFREDTFYCFAARLPLSPRFEAGDMNVIRSYIKPMKTTGIVSLNPSEMLVPFKPSFYSKATESDRYLGYPLITPFSFSRSRAVFSPLERGLFLDGQCWASSPPSDDSYEDWHLEMDMGCARHVTAVILQGRSPHYQLFPSPSHFASHTDALKYKGPAFPVIPQGYELQWVERAEIYFRREKGEWISLGIFAACHDFQTQVRIDLRLPEGLRIRYIRIRPLAKNKRGYVGSAPAMRAAVVAVDEPHLASKPITLQEMNLDNDKFIRYRVLVPDEDAEGVSEKAKYVSGRAVRWCGGHYNRYHRDAYNTKESSARFHRKKAFQMMLNDADTFVG